MIEGIKSLKNIESLEGKRVLLRLDLNVPLSQGKVEDDYRIKRSIPTVEFLKEGGAKVIILSHIWKHESETLRPVYEHLKSLIDVDFIEDCIGDLPKKAIEKMGNGDVILLENLRKYDNEKNNDPDFTKELASLGDIYVNEAFSSSHREHSSIVGLPEVLPSYIGFLFEDEIKNLSKALNPEHPFLFILGGAKSETKIPLIFKYLDIADYVYVAGALANDFFRVKGFETGLSLVSGKDYGIQNYLDKKNLILPIDVTVKRDEEVSVKKPNEVLSDEKILDIGSESMKDLESLVKKSKFILWNGPLGDYEKGFKEGTIILAKYIAESDAKSILGGGDTLAVVSKLNLTQNFNFRSTAGGALLEFLYAGTLPGIEALKKSK